jgi:hypothetical protein
VRAGPSSWRSMELRDFMGAFLRRQFSQGHHGGHSGHISLIYLGIDRPYSPLRRECRIASAALYAHVRTLSTIAHETAGAARIRHSLRPLFYRARRISCKPRAPCVARTRNCICRHCEPTGRANARPTTGSARQSMPPHEERTDCFASLEMTVLDGR